MSTKSKRKTLPRDIERAALIQKTARITGVTTRSVRRVIEGEQKNETVMTTYMELQEGDNRLLEAVRKLVPFNR